MKNKIKKWLGIDEIEDVLIREGEEGKPDLHLGSEIDGKVEKAEFDKIIKEIKDKVFKKPESYSLLSRSWFFLSSYEAPDPISFEERLIALEKYLGIEYKVETKKTNGYKKIKSKVR